MRGHETHKKTNPTDGKGKGRGGRKNFIDEILSKAESSQRLSSLRPKPQRSPQSNYETEEVVSPKNVKEPATRVEEAVDSIEEPEESNKEPVENVEESAGNVEKPVENIKEPVENFEDREICWRRNRSRRQDPGSEVGANKGICCSLEPR